MEPGVQRNTSKVSVVSVGARAHRRARVPVHSVNTGADALLVDEMLQHEPREKGGSVSLLAARF
jgi:hypothetical protein